MTCLCVCECLYVQKHLKTFPFSHCWIGKQSLVVYRVSFVSFRKTILSKVLINGRCWTVQSSNPSLACHVCPNLVQGEKKNKSLFFTCVCFFFFFPFLFFPACYRLKSSFEPCSWLSQILLLAAKSLSDWNWNGRKKIFNILFLQFFFCLSPLMKWPLTAPHPTLSNAEFYTLNFNYFIKLATNGYLEMKTKVI